MPAWSEMFKPPKLVSFLTESTKFTASYPQSMNLSLHLISQLLESVPQTPILNPRIQGLVELKRLLLRDKGTQAYQIFLLQTGINPVDDPSRFGANQHKSNKLISAKNYLQLAKGDLSRCADILVNFQLSLQQYAKVKHDPSKSYNPLALLR